MILDSIFYKESYYELLQNTYIYLFKFLVFENFMQTYDVFYDHLHDI